MYIASYNTHKLYFLHYRKVICVWENFKVLKDWVISNPQNFAADKINPVN